ncbi:ABC transporter permease [Candidatus Poribacteria bacterium]|nr:ABC transporter permease [Candidatus Poribacteria bacterium]MBT5535131.1 ABC transporter permease [Candidatus Poribacteria bacterium]MBT5709882.1 ABC transporter permease [Candidatus Poribacteria bacterium]MBT7101419.1 ABC transporter permease [Candidatus Poribacteria bacterium]MBT7805767.1 ABC transporter permease [Candidatus Poribacteria bacterium]
MEFAFELVAAAVRLSIPILLAASGEVWAQRSGVINIGLEGTMLAGAFAGMAGAHMLRVTPALGPWLGLAMSAATGVALAGVFAYFTVRRGADQIVTGTAINLTALGATAFLNRMAYSDIVSVPGFTGGTRVALFIGALAIVPVSYLLLHRSNLGLLVHATGEHPRAVDTVGVSALRVRGAATMFGGGMAGLAGGYLLLTAVPTFIESMTAGRGFIAIAIVIFGRWNALGVAAAALFFGFADALQLRLEAVGVGVPDEFLKMLPYVLTLAVLATGVGATRAPAALGQPYARG